VLRAIETRRPVVRVGNGGWSGWIDEYGRIRATVQDEAGSVYFRGAQTLEITRDARWKDKQSLYVEHGDWFLLLCAGLTAAGYLVVAGLRPPRPAPGESPGF
jgi:apolipoprotein N-acyltransferase